MTQQAPGYRNFGEASSAFGLVTYKATAGICDKDG
jgi:hypothetical protein